jgi:hypothetical protein
MRRQLYDFQIQQASHSQRIDSVSWRPMQTGVFDAFSVESSYCRGQAADPIHRAGVFSGKSLYSGALPPTFKGRAKPPKPEPHRRSEVSLGDTMKTVRLFQILMFAGILVAAASASDDSLPPVQSTAGQYIFAETSTAPAPARNDGAGSQTSPAFDRRDRIFCPGDTERPIPRL